MVFGTIDRCLAGDSGFLTPYDFVLNFKMHGFCVENMDAAFIDWKNWFFIAWEIATFRPRRFAMLGNHKNLDRRAQGGGYYPLFYLSMLHVTPDNKRY